MPGFKISSFAFADHNVCGMKTILNFCIDSHLFLSEHDKRGTLYHYTDNSPDSKNAVIAVHCKAGKGRTGLMIISFLIFSDHQFER
jgi:phosphatidylinositol-3,4,5-trisphosphate 3-phosphatase/dual-specificity protein phosphatase PTEN